MTVRKREKRERERERERKGHKDTEKERNGKTVDRKGYEDQPIWHIYNIHVKYKQENNKI